MVNPTSRVSFDCPNNAIAKAFSEKLLSGLKEEALKNGRVVPGYGDVYYDLFFGDIFLSERISSKDNSAKIHTGFKSATEWDVSVVSASCSDDGKPLRLTVMRKDTKKGFCLPVYLLHSDVVPQSFERFAYEEIRLKIACFAENFVAYEGGEKEKDKTVDEQEINAVREKIFPKDAFARKEKSEDSENEDIQSQICLSGKILNVRKKDRIPLENGKRGIPAFVVVTVNTGFGPLDIVKVEDELTERQRSLLKAGNYVNVVGQLYADAAIGEYESGAVFDQLREMRVFAGAVNSGSMHRISNMLAPRCKYDGPYKIKKMGGSAIKEYFEKMLEMEENSEKKKITAYYGELFIDDALKEQDHFSGEKCLILMINKNALAGFLFFEFNKEERVKIKKITLELGLKDGVDFKSTTDFSLWRKGLANAPTELEDEGMTEEDDSITTFYMAEKVAGRLHGNPSYLDGKPFSTFGEVWNSLGISVRKDLGRYLEDAKLGGTHVLIKGKMDVVYLDYPNSGEHVFIRFIVTKDDKENAQLQSAFPITEGYPQELTVEARYDCEDRISGFVGGTIAGHAIAFFVPSYAANREAFEVGKKVFVDISGIAIDIAKPVRDSIAVERGPYFEMMLEDFLNEHPDKTVADFTPPELIMGGSVIWFPTSVLAYYTLRSKIAEVDEVAFDGNAIYRILMPVMKNEGGKEVTAYVYAAKSFCEDYVPAQDEDVQCGVVLCAELSGGESQKSSNSATKAVL